MPFGQPAPCRCHRRPASRNRAGHRRDALAIQIDPLDHAAAQTADGPPSAEWVAANGPHAEDAVGTTEGTEEVAALGAVRALVAADGIDAGTCTVLAIALVTAVRCADTDGPRR